LRAFGQALVASLVAYALLIQTLALPFAQVRAQELARIDASLGVICMVDGSDSAPSDRSTRDHHHNGVDCCLAACCASFAGPAIVATSDISLPALLTTTSLFKPDANGPRAPPAALLSQLQPRAPPSQT